jgi:choline kinase
MDSGLAAGLEEFVVVTGYEADRLTAFLTAFSRASGVKVTPVYNPRWTERNGLSVAAGGPALADTFVLMMSDHLFDPRIVQGLVAAGRGDADLVLAVDRRLDNPLVDLDDVTRVQTDGSGAIRRIGKGIEPFDAFDTGLFLASQALIASIRDDVAQGGGGSISEGVQALADAGRARVFDVGARFWIDVDDAIAFGQAEQALGRPPEFASRGAGQ